LCFVNKDINLDRTKYDHNRIDILINTPDRIFRAKWQRETDHIRCFCFFVRMF